jgi:hypothetical protein
MVTCKKIILDYALYAIFALGIFNIVLTVQAGGPNLGLAIALSIVTTGLIIAVICFQWTARKADITRAIDQAHASQRVVANQEAADKGRMSAEHAEQIAKKPTKRNRIFWLI